jgi:hypothetical protein
LTYHVLEDLSGSWVVVIGLDLLSLACSSLVWVVAMFQHHAYVTRLVLAYQPTAMETAGLFSEAAMAEPWDGVGKAAMAEPTRHKRGLLGAYDAHTGSKTSVGTLQAR